MNLATVITQDPPPGFLASRFGLSPAESTTAAGIAAGKTPKRLALDRGISVHTVRTQMQFAFIKMHVASQAGLVSTVWRAWAAHTQAELALGGSTT